jgi:hypothetical protein
MSFLSLISQYFGLDQDPAKGKWPRRVANNELPPERIPVVLPHERRPLPSGISDPIGWREVTFNNQQKPQRTPKAEMNDFLHDGAVFPTKKDK